VVDGAWIDRSRVSFSQGARGDHVLQFFGVLCRRLLNMYFAGLLMQMEEPNGAEGINDMEQPEGSCHDRGPLAPLDEGNVVHDAIEGDQDVAEVDQGREV
jgi:hypothetical protein